MTYLLGQVQYDKERKGVNDTERSVSFLAIGKLAVVAKQDIERYLDDIMQSIKDGLKAKRYHHVPLTRSFMSHVAIHAS